MKIVIIIALLAIIGALASAGTFMLRKRPGLPKGPEGSAPAEPDRHMARALALRVSLSVAIFLLVLLAWSLGWIRPGGLPVGG